MWESSINCKITRQDFELGYMNQGQVCHVYGNQAGKIKPIFI